MISDALEHNYKKPKFIWSDDKKSCEASFVCSSCGNIEKVECEITSKVIKKSNCIEEGIEEYTAKCKFQGNFYNDNRAKMIARLTPDVSLEETKLTVHVTEGKEIDLNSNYPNDYIKSLKAAKNGIVRVKGNEIYGENQGK